MDRVARRSYLILAVKLRYDLFRSEQDSGELTKAGTGTLTLTGANSYTAATTVSAGMPWSATSGSGTGTGLEVNAGTLGGRGVIAGAVTIGTGSGAELPAPGVASNQTGKLTLKKR